VKAQDYFERRQELFRQLDQTDPDVLGLGEAAKRLGVPEVTLRAAAARGSLWAVKIGPIWVTTSRWLAWYLVTRRTRKSATWFVPLQTPQPDASPGLHPREG